jgi:hypothetical protein
MVDNLPYPTITCDDAEKNRPLHRPLYLGNSCDYAAKPAQTPNPARRHLSYVLPGDM